ncbi:MAG: response regulator, partial [Synergistaceae bacterium]|nr:response regulator [Synergistaceae bacterium]
MDRIRNRIIVVDDNLAILDHARELLKPFYEVYLASTVIKMFEILEHFIPDLIILDIEMPKMCGYEAIKKLKSDVRFANIPVILLSLMRDEIREKKGFDLGAVDYVYKPFSGPLLLKRIETQFLIKDLQSNKAALKDYACSLKKMVVNKVQEMFYLHAVLNTVADLMESRNKHTDGHISRIQLYLQAIIEEMFKKEIYATEISQWNLDFFLPSTQLHDVGKIAIPELILNKPAKLTPEEFDIMKTHVIVGVDAIEKIMSNTNEHIFLRHALLITGTHHEKWDGSGYPAGLKGEDIPLEGRLMAIADVYDAL